MDADGNGTIDINELGAAFRKEGKDISDREIEVKATSINHTHLEPDCHEEIE
jgi:Ca2+-binding EF-hand superfamily protein